MHADRVELSWDASKSNWLLGSKLARKSFGAIVLCPRVRMSRHFARPSRRPSRMKVMKWIRRVWFVANGDSPAREAELERPLRKL